MIDQQVFNTIFGAIDYKKPGIDEKERAKAHYKAEGELAVQLLELAEFQKSALVRFWEASRKANPGFTAQDAISAVRAFRNTDLQKKAISDFEYHVTITEYAEARA